MGGNLRDDGLWTVPMLGRQLLVEIRDRMQHSSTLFLYGLAGVGKSHLLALLALERLGVQLANDAAGQPTQPVCFIPNLGKCAADVEGVWKALVEALILHPRALAALAEVRRESPTLPLMFLFARLSGIVTMNNVVVIADQHNALDTTGPDDSCDPLCVAIKKFIKSVGGRLPSQPKAVFAASANQKSISMLATKQDGIAKVCA